MAKKITANRAGGDSKWTARLISLLAGGKPSGAGGKTDALQSEHVRVLYASQISSVLFNIIIALTFAAVQISVIPPLLVFAWCVCLGLILLLRTALFILWRRQTSAESNSRLWLYWFRISAIGTGVVWGVGGVLLSPAGDPSHQIYTSFVLAGLCAGASSTLAIDRASIGGFLFAVLVPQIIFQASVGTSVLYGMSLMNLLFLLFLLAASKRSRHQLDENISLQQKATENESRLQRMLETSPIATAIMDATNGRVEFANTSFISLLESTREHVVGLASSSYYANPDAYADILETVDRGAKVTNELVELHSPEDNGWVKWVLASYCLVEYQDKPAVLCWLYDITERKLSEDEAKHMAYHDTLTGLPNRLLFVDRLQRAITSADSVQGSVAVMYIDLDDFKPVNDRYGHHVGDLLLKLVAKRILGCLRKSDTAARIGGDEFVILLLSVDTEQNALDIGNKIRSVLNEPFEIEGVTVTISSSSGLAVYPDHASDVQELIKRADIAMYFAKGQGRDCARAYRPEMEDVKAELVPASNPEI